MKTKVSSVSIDTDYTAGSVFVRAIFECGSERTVSEEVSKFAKFSDMLKERICEEFEKSTGGKIKEFHRLILDMNKKEYGEFLHTQAAALMADGSKKRFSVKIKL